MLELRDPGFAAFLAWLFPGLGHFYQRRYAKGAVFTICIMTIYLYGMFITDGRAVYAAWSPQNKRFYYLAQLGMGLPALPALVEAQRVNSGKGPLFGGWWRPPQDNRELDELHRVYAGWFELGTIYTALAGLLNVLVIYDAWQGPAYVRREGEEDDEDGTKKPPPDDAT